MKKMLFAAFAAVAVLAASCSKDPDSGKRTGEVADAVVQIAVDPSMFTRGDFDQIGGDDLTQTAVTVQDGLYVFLGQGADIIVSTDLAQNATSGIMTKDRSGNNLTTAVDKIIILGNLPDGINYTGVDANDLDKITTVAGLQTALKRTLEQAETDYLKSTPVIWVQGEVDIAPAEWTDDTTPGNEGKQKVNKTIALAPVLSRIDLTVNLEDVDDGVFASVNDLKTYRSASTGNAKLKDGMVITGVAVLNSAKESFLVTPFTPETGSANALYSGLAGLPVKAKVDHYNPANVTGQSLLHATWDDDTWNAANKNYDGTASEANYVEASTNEVMQGKFKRSFYAFSPKNFEASTGAGHFISEENGYQAATMIVVYGEKYDYLGTKKSDYYWTYKFDPSEVINSVPGEPLEPGTRYTVALNFKGDFSNGGGGSTDPEDNKDDGAVVNISISAAKWKAVVDISKNFEDN